MTTYNDYVTRRAALVCDVLRAGDRLRDQAASLLAAAEFAAAVLVACESIFDAEEIPEPEMLMPALSALRNAIDAAGGRISE